MTNNALIMRRYLAVHLPWLPAERARRANVAPPETDFALTASVRGGTRIVAVAPTADPGLIGLSLADARARVPGLAVAAYDGAADAAMLEWLADDCEIFSPTVALDPPDGLLIDITGCSDGDDLGPLAAAVGSRLQQWGFTAAVAVGPTPDAAAALARCEATRVEDLPLSALRIDPAVRQALHRTGLTTVGALAARPRASLAARFGPLVPTLLARLLGDEDVRLVPRRPPPAVVAERRFAEPVTATAAIRAAFDRLMAEAAAQLAARGLGGRRFDATLFRSDGHVARLTIATGAPTRDPAVLGRLLTERIEALADPLDPGFGYDLIRFAVPVVEPLGAMQLALDGERAAEAEVAALVDRLTTRLGHGRVRRLASGDSHVPERAAFDHPVGSPATAWRIPAPGEPPLHPLLLFTPPQPIDVLAEVPDGPPRGFRWKGLRHDILRAEGPERIAAEWWRRRDDGGHTRDYYRLEDAGGRRFWVFRHGLYGAETTSPRWYLHGLFA